MIKDFSNNNVGIFESSNTEFLFLDNQTWLFKNKSEYRSIQNIHEMKIVYQFMLKI